MDHHWSPGRPRSLAQERRLLGIAFDEVNLGPFGLGEGTGDNQAGEPAAGTKVDPSAGMWRERQELQRIGDMARPQFRFGRGGDQIDAALPVEEKRDEAIEPRFCFT